MRIHTCVYAPIYMKLVTHWHAVPCTLARHEDQNIGVLHATATKTHFLSHACHLLQRRTFSHTHASATKIHFLSHACICKKDTLSLTRMQLFSPTMLKMTECLVIDGLIGFLLECH